jgi:hypothetical protein
MIALEEQSERALQGLAEEGGQSAYVILAVMAEALFGDESQGVAPNGPLR